jgi:hypothetical protein
MTVMKPIQKSVQYCHSTGQQLLITNLTVDAINLYNHGGVNIRTKMIMEMFRVIINSVVNNHNDQLFLSC